jgi:hypothetical protein
LYLEKIINIRNLSIAFFLITLSIVFIFTIELAKGGDNTIDIARDFGLWMYIITLIFFIIYVFVFLFQIDQHIVSNYNKNIIIFVMTFGMTLVCILFIGFECKSSGCFNKNQLLGQTWPSFALALLALVWDMATSGKIIKILNIQPNSKYKSIAREAIKLDIALLCSYGSIFGLVIYLDLVSDNTNNSIENIAIIVASGEAFILLMNMLLYTVENIRPAK